MNYRWAWKILPRQLLEAAEALNCPSLWRVPGGHQACSLLPGPAGSLVWVWWDPSVSSRVDVCGPVC